MPDSQVNWYQAVAHDENVYWSDLQGDGSVGPRIWLRRAKQTVRAIDADYLCDEIARNRVSGFRGLSDNSLKRIQETNGMENTTRVSTRWHKHLRARRRIALGRRTTFRESIQAAEKILFQRNAQMDPMATWANERWHDLQIGVLFAFDEEWANRAWNDLEFFDSMDSKESASAHGQSESNLGLLRSAHVRPPDIPMECGKTPKR